MVYFYYVCINKECGLRVASDEIVRRIMGPAGTDVLLSIQRGDDELNLLVRRRTIQLAKETFEFQPGDFIRLFFSYRHTPDRVRELLGQQGVSVIDQWITRSEEEGVFLCRRARFGESI